MLDDENLDDHARIDSARWASRQEFRTRIGIGWMMGTLFLVLVLSFAFTGTTSAAAAGIALGVGAVSGCIGNCVSACLFERARARFAGVTLGYFSGALMSALLIFFVLAPFTGGGSLLCILPFLLIPALSLTGYVVGSRMDSARHVEEAARDVAGLDTAPSSPALTPAGNTIQALLGITPILEETEPQVVNAPSNVELQQFDESNRMEYVAINDNDESQQRAFLLSPSS